MTTCLHGFVWCGNTSGRGYCSDECRKQAQDAGKMDVHTEHCCRLHGCKYDDPDCTVMSSEKQQSGPCELCEPWIPGADGKPLDGCDVLRRIVSVMGDVRESFNQRFTISELVAIYSAHLQSGWDIPPDRWEERQVQEAIEGEVPRWDKNGKPRYID